MWVEPVPTLAERRERHYNALAAELGAFTIANLPCPTCEEHEVIGQVICWLNWDGSVGGTLRQPLVFLSAAPSTEQGYLAGLHELGHVATGFCLPKRPRWSTRRQEAEAWLWALDKTISEPSPHAWRWIARLMESYIHPRHKTDLTFDRLLLEATKKGTE